MELEEKAEEVLETLWIRTKEGKEGSLLIDELGGDEAKWVMKRLLLAGYITISEGKLKLSEKGCVEAENVVRRHRLAERLLADVLGAHGVIVHEKACKFEHLLDRGLDEAICTLLGHPKVCPHGSPIPPGSCCRQRLDWTPKLVSPLSELAPGRFGRIAYIHSPEPDRLQKLMSMGVVPGASLRLIQNFPSYVFQISQTQIAIDKEIADAIYVRVGESPSEAIPGRRSLWQRLKCLIGRA